MTTYRITATAHNGRDPIRPLPPQTIDAPSAIDAAGQIAAANPQPQGWTLTVSAQAERIAFYEFGSYDFRAACALPDLDL